VRSLHSIAEALSLHVNYFFPEEEQQKAAPPESTAPPPQPPASTTATVTNMTPREFREASLNQTDVGFDVTLGHPKEPVVRANMRPHIELLGGIVWERLTPTAEEGAEFLQIYYEVGATSGERMSHHSGREFHLVLEGDLLLELGFERYVLKAGDSIIFDSTTPHRLSNVGNVPLRAISVIITEQNQ
jgi:mannose-6-phosphate isomerase-like protein (cupin superfamily)